MPIPCLMRKIHRAVEALLNVVESTKAWPKIPAALETSEALQEAILRQL